MPGRPLLISLGSLTSLVLIAQEILRKSRISHDPGVHGAPAGQYYQASPYRS